ncbi:oocyte zinc finger protein XlCOF10-like [Diabrotica virgifera virgifera]|uniref:Oocyte zinc finger protein XlCOF10-like isoform X2 n=1 Tax=Diabrotica virgifera virgifera TaxID=50390 RepID=A0A6P7GBI1_DIAVI|nr:oocyte zinc finger protein XlCOF10-like [Diabrotica virgifera virgifera]
MQENRKLQNRFECLYCDEWFVTDEDRNLHNRSKHMKSSCMYCDELFLTEEECHRHNFDEHYFPCRHCGDWFTDEEEREDHEKEHLVVDCPHCKESFPDVADGPPGVQKSEILQVCEEVDRLSHQLIILCAQRLFNSPQGQDVARKLSQNYMSLKKKLTSCSE